MAVKGLRCSIPNSRSVLNMRFVWGINAKLSNVPFFFTIVNPVYPLGPKLSTSFPLEVRKCKTG